MPDRVLVRDSKDPDGPALSVPPRPGGRSSPPSPADHSGHRVGRAWATGGRAPSGDPGAAVRLICGHTRV
ncbi:MAG TPA: DUF397 domain-containing protein [Pseudonocardiaceae bacterium]|nr:DUF397 domain-containing protein [Pseudonocardiaceae bacterium]